MVLDDICEVITCGVAKRPEYVSSGIPFLSSKNVKKDKFILDHYNLISEKDYVQLTKYNKPEKGDILYTRVGSFGDAAVVDFDFKFAIFVSLTLIKPKQSIVFPRYLMHYLNSPDVVKLAENSTSGIGVQNLNVNVVRKFPISLPLIEQQKKIAAILDAADAYRQLTKALIAKYDELTQSLFLDMFGDYLNSELIPLGEVVKFSQGQQFGLEFQSLTPKEGYDRFLRIIDFTQGDDLRYVPNDNNKYFVFKDDIVIVRYGASAGFVGTNKEGVLANNLFKVNYDRKVFHQYFLYYIFQNERFKLFVEKEAFGAAMPALSFKVMERFEIPVPPVTLQNQFAERVQAIEQQKAQAQAALEKAEELFNSLLQRAFKGELV